MNQKHEVNMLNKFQVEDKAISTTTIHVVLVTLWLTLTQSIDAFTVHDFNFDSDPAIFFHIF